MARSTVSLLITAIFSLCCYSAGHAQVADRESSIEELMLRLDQQEAEIRELRSRLNGDAGVEQASGELPLIESHESHRGGPIHMLPVMAEDTSSTLMSGCVVGSGTAASEASVLNFRCEYDDGFVLVRPSDSSRHPFELKANGWIQFRHHAFSRNVESWTDNAGTTRPVVNRNAFDIERARLVFSGYAKDRRLTYFLQLDGDTDGGHLVDFFDYWWAWECSDRLRIQIGKRKVPASYQWLLSARHTRLVDRPMANDFFRPDRTVGLFLTSKIGNSSHLELMAGNGYRTANLPTASIDDRISFAARYYYEPFGKFGGQPVDYDWVRHPLLLVGHSLVYSPQRPDPSGRSLEEADFVRLTDGTRLTQEGALARGVTVSGFDIYFYGVDAAWKWRGWSINGELFLRWLESIRGSGPLAVGNLFQRGFYVEGGHFLVPRRLDANARYSQVSGLFGNSSEYAAGMNWYPKESSDIKISFDVTYLDGSPLQNTASDILVGDAGMLFRTQIQAEF
jgi:hypothetical protein